MLIFSSTILSIVELAIIPKMIPRKTRREGLGSTTYCIYLMSSTALATRKYRNPHGLATERKTQNRLGSCEAGQPNFTRWRLLPGNLVELAKCMLHNDLGPDDYLADQLLLPLYQAGGGST